MPTSAHWEVANLPKITVKNGAFCRADVGIGPYNQVGYVHTDSPKVFDDSVHPAEWSRALPLPTQFAVRLALCMNMMCFSVFKTLVVLTIK